MREKTERVFNQLLSIILIVTLVGSLVTQVEISSVSALADPATGIKASSKFGTLQIDHSEYDLTYVNSTSVRVNGTIATLNSIDKLVIILFTLPDGSTKGSQIAPNDDGTFQISLPLDPNSQKGTYSVTASYAQNTLGALTFTVKLIPVGIQSFSHLQTQAQNQIKTQNVTKTSSIATNLHTPIVINDNATGGNCWLVGRFDAVSKTCILLQDLPVGIVIASNGIILDGNEHVLNASHVGDIGVYLKGVNNINLKNLKINNFDIGIQTSNAGNTTVTDNTISNNQVGIYVNAESSDQIYNNNFIDNQKNIKSDWTTLSSTFSLPLPVGGNYWSQFNTTKGCNDLDYNNICDDPYTQLGYLPRITDNLPWNYLNGWHTKFLSNENITTIATSLSGNSIKYNISASVDNKHLQVNCSPSSGSVFPIGTTIVKCTAENGRKTSFGVSVIDTPPVIDTLPNLVVEADNFSGAVVAYSQPHAVDNIGVTNGPTCNPSSFSLFSPGINIVKCTASDGSGNIGSANFTITVKNTKQQIILECQKNLLSNVFPTTVDGLTWSLHSERDMTYLNNQKEIAGYEREYAKTDGFSSGDLVVDVYQYDSNDEAKKINNDEITSNQNGAPAGYTQLNGLGFPSECYGMKEDFGFNERVRLFCVKDNFKIYVGGLGSLLGLEDELTNFAKMTINKIGNFEEHHSSLISQECVSKSSSFVYIPNWIRNNARGWHDNSINDNMFKQGIQYMIQQKIISLPQTQSNTTTVKSIPSWIKNNAEWWADEQIQDDEFVKGIQYLIQQGIIKVS